MKLSQIRPCDNCGGAIVPLFYIVRISLAMFNARAVNEQMGLTQMFGGGAAGLQIAEVMGAHGHDVVKIAGDQDVALMDELFLCQDCYMHPLILAELVEIVNSKKPKEEPE